MSTELLSAFSVFRERANWIQEDEFVLRGEVAIDGEAVAEIQALEQSAQAEACEVRWSPVDDAAFEDGFSLADPGLKGATRTILVRKPEPTPARKFFFETDRACSWASLHSQNFESTEEVVVADLAKPFETRTCKFQVWRDGQYGRASDVDVANSGADPRRIVKATHPEICPTTALAWLPVGDAPVPTCFTTLFVTRLGRTLAPELQQDAGGQVAVFIRGARTQKVDATPPDPGEDHSLLLRDVAEAAEWIFVNEADADLRHGLLASELAREWDPEISWFEGLRNRLSFALQNAKSAYSLHLHELGTDALNQMSTLRRALSDDAGRLSGLMSSMQSSIWRDTALGAGFIVLRLSGADVPYIAATAVTAYLVISFLVNLLNIRGVLGAIAHEESSARKRLYHFVQADDFKELYAKPLEQLRCKVWMVLGLSGILSLGLVVLVWAAAGTIEPQWPFGDALISEKDGQTAESDAGTRMYQGPDSSGTRGGSAEVGGEAGEPAGGGIDGEQSSSSP